MRALPTAALTLALSAAACRAFAGGAYDLPSVTSLRLSGHVAKGGRCILRCEIEPGPDGAPPFTAEALRLERMDGRHNTEVLGYHSPTPDGKLLVVNVIDRKARRGRTYRYLAKYEADISLLSDVVYLSVPADGGAWSPPSAGGLTVEILEPTLFGAGTAALLRARSNGVEPTYEWRSLAPGIVTVLASHDDAALVRVEDVLGYSAACIEVLCREGSEAARDSAWIPAVKMIWTQPHTVDADRVREARANPSVVGPMLRKNYRSNAVHGMNLYYFEEFIEAVGQPAACQVLDYAAECQDLSTRAHLYGLAGSLDARLAISTLREEKLYECMTRVLIGLAARLEPRPSDEAPELLKPFLLHECPMIRSYAVGTLGSVGSRSNAEALDAIRLKDPIGWVRFEAGQALGRVMPGPCPRVDHRKEGGIRRHHGIALRCRLTMWSLRDGCSPRRLPISISRTRWSASRPSPASAAAVARRASLRSRHPLTTSTGGSGRARPGPGSQRLARRRCRR